MVRTDPKITAEFKNIRENIVLDEQRLYILNLLEHDERALTIWRSWEKISYFPFSSLPAMLEAILFIKELVDGKSRLDDLIADFDMRRFLGMLDASKALHSFFSGVSYGRLSVQDAERISDLRGGLNWAVEYLEKAKSLLYRKFEEFEDIPRSRKRTHPALAFEILLCMATVRMLGLSTPLYAFVATITEVIFGHEVTDEAVRKAWVRHQLRKAG